MKLFKLVTLDRLRRTTALFSAASLFVTQSTGAAMALPTEGQVNAGTASIISSSSAQVDINQTSQRVIFDWGSFNIGRGETVNFSQPNSSAVSLNRIHDANPSRIDGALNANGQVWLVNSQGILFGSGAQLSVGGLLATASDIDNSRFMSGDDVFDQPGNPFASIVNAGQITAADYGLVALAGPNVINSGTIRARLGKVQLASGDIFTLDLYGDGLINLQASDAITSQLVSNSGEIAADGGHVLLKKAAARDVVDGLVNMDGFIQADSIDGRTGNVSLESDGGTTLVSGTINARGQNAGEKGGLVGMLAHYVGVVDDATVDASGSAGGGTVLVGGDAHGGNGVQTATRTIVLSGARLKANATDNGDGGKVIVWSDERTDFAGLIEAKGGTHGGNGGFVETSGKMSLSSIGNVDASSVWGKAGLWLLDPNNITIQTAGGDTNVAGSPNFTTTDDSAIVTTGSIETALNAGTSVTLTTGTAGINAQAGDITVANNVSKTAGGDATLTLIAANDIIVNGGVSISSNTNKLNVTFDSDADASGAGAIVMNSGSSITSNGGNITLGGGANPLTDNAVGSAPVGILGNVGLALTAATLNAGGGNIALHGAGGSNGGGGNYGIDCNHCTVSTTGTGNITAVGAGGTAAGSDIGVNVSGILSVVDGALSITGTGVGAGAGTANYGIWMNSGIARATGTGTVTLTGTGGATVGIHQYGVFNTFGAVSTNSGALTINGTGGGMGAGSAGSGDYGYVSIGSVTSVTGPIAINGSGGSASGGGNYGIYLSSGDSTTSTGSSNITLTGIGGGGGANNYGIYLDTSGGTIGNATATGDIGFIADTLVMNSNTGAQTTGNVSVQAYNAATTVGVAGAAGTLQVTEAFLNLLSAHTVTIGRSDGSGLVRENGVDLSAQTYNLSLLNGNADIQFDGGGTALTMAANKSFSATTSGGITIPSLAGTITTTGSGGITLTPGGGGVVNIGQALTLASGSGGISLAGPVTLGAALNADAGTGTLAFGGAIDGGFDLTGSGGSITFAQNLGGTTPLASASLTSTNSMTLPSISAASILARTTGAVADLTIAAGKTLTASGGGTAITLATGRNFINNAGAGALSTPAGRWLVYSTSPSSDVIGGLSSDFTTFSCVYGGSCPVIPAMGNGFLYSTAIGGSGPSGANRVSLPSSVVDVIAMNQTQLIRLVQPARLIYAELQLLDMLGFPPDMSEPWWDVIVW